MSPQSDGVALRLQGEHLWIAEEPLPASQQGEHSIVWRGYRADDATRQVAIKTVPQPPSGANPDAVQQIRREIRRLHSMPPTWHVAGLVDQPASSEELWYVMEWAGCGSLAKYYGPSASPVRALREVLAFAIDIVIGLDESQVVHRDIKPANLLVYSEPRSGTGTVLRICDWGRSLDHGTDWRSQHLRPRRLAFAAPQVVDSSQPADVRDDLLSVGAIIWWCVTGGGAPISDARGSAVRQRLDDLYPVIPGRLADLVAILLQYDRTGRAPGTDDRAHHLGFVSNELTEILNDLDVAEARGDAVQVGPGAPTARQLAPGASARQQQALPAPSSTAEYVAPQVHASPSAPAPSTTPPLAAAPVARPRQPAPATMPQLAPSPVTMPGLAPAMPIPGPAPAPTAGASPIGADPDFGTAASRDDDQDTARSDARPPTSGSRVAYPMVAFLAVLHLVGAAALLVMIGVTPVVAFVVAVLIASGAALLDILVAERLCEREATFSFLAAVPTRAGFGARIGLGVALALLASYAIVHRTYRDDLTSSRLSAERTQLDATLGQLAATHLAAVKTRHEQEDNLKQSIAKDELRIERLKQAARAKPTTGEEGLDATSTAPRRCGEPCLTVRRKIVTAKQELAKLRTSGGAEAAAFRKARSATQKQIAATPATVSDSRSLTQYAGDHPVAFLLCAGLLLVILAVELAVFIAARTAASWRLSS